MYPAAESNGQAGVERSSSPSGIFEREEARANMARQNLLNEYRAIQAENRRLIKQDNALKEEYLLVIRENQELETTCYKAIAAELETAERLEIAESGCCNLNLLVNELDEAIVKEQDTVSGLRAELSLAMNRSSPDTLELRQTQAQLKDLQNRYDTLCNTHTEAEQRRKVDIQKWMELKTRLESDNAKLKAALRKEKAKTAAAGATENARIGLPHQQQQLDENQFKCQSQGKSERTMFSDRREGRTPLRTVGTAVNRVRNEQMTSQGNDGSGLDEQIYQRHALDQGAVKGAAPVPTNPYTALAHERASRAQQSSSKHVVPDGPRHRAGPIDDVQEVVSSSEKERTDTEQVLDTPGKFRSPRHSHQNREQQVPAPIDLPDIDGSATEEDEEMPLTRRADLPIVESAGHASVLHLKSHDVLDPSRSDRTRSGKQSPLLRTPNDAKTTTVSSRITPGVAATIVSDTRKAVLSSSRTERPSNSRLDRTPSGLHWLGGDKSKISRRDSFEDEVGPSTRVQLKQEVTAVLPRPTTSRQLNAGSDTGASSIRLPGERQLRIEPALDTPARVSGAATKRKREALPHTPLIPFKSSTSTPRSDKKPRLTASNTRPTESRKDQVYVVNPKANGGKNYTFQSVERNKEKRQCMHGEACHECDAWYDATSDIQHVPAIRFGATPSPQSLIDEDQEELAQAQRQKLMNSVSRHKVEHEKNPTPPGYWEPGMPSTQTVERQNMAADVMAQAKRERQRREANKEDGLWMVLNKNNESSIRSLRKS